MPRHCFDNCFDRTGSHCEKHGRMKELFGRDDLIPLWVADMEFETPPFIMEAIRARALHPSVSYSYRPDGFYNALCGWIGARHGWAVDPRWVCFCPGVVSSISFAINAFSDKGDKIVIQPPVYPPFARVVKLNERELVCSPLVNNDGYYTIDFDDLDKKLQGAKMLILCNPHNPVGRAFTRDELMGIGRLCLKHGALILSDEIHHDLVQEPCRHLHLASLSDEIAGITLTSLAASKTFNTAGLSTSACIIPDGKLRERYQKEAEKYHVDQGNIFGAVALEAAYTHGPQWVDDLNGYLSDTMNYVVDFVQTNMPRIKTVKPEATYLMWFDCRQLGLAQPQLEDFFINRARLAVNSGTMFGPEGEGFVRVNIASPRATIEQAMRQLKEAYDKL